MSNETKGYVCLGIAKDRRLEKPQGSIGMSVDGRRDWVRTEARQASGFYRAVATLFMLLCSLLVTAQAAETVTYYYTSPQGTVLATADSGGNVLNSADYRPYGGQALGTPEQGPGYTGHVNDVDSGLVYMQARYYDPGIGRFLSVDPVGTTPGDLVFARFAYAANNPVVNIDPDGRQSCGDSGCSVGPTPYNFFRDNPVGRVVGNTLGDPIAVFRNDSLNPITSETLNKGEIAEAKLGILTLAIPSSRVEAVAMDATKEGMLVVKSISAHAVDRAIDRSVKPASILDALRSPLKTTAIRTDDAGLSSFKVIGEKATVTINPDTGRIITVNPTSSDLSRRLLRQKDPSQ